MKISKKQKRNNVAITELSTYSNTSFDKAAKGAIEAISNNSTHWKPESIVHIFDVLENVVNKSTDITGIAPLDISWAKDNLLLQYGYLKSMVSSDWLVSRTSQFDFDSVYPLFYEKIFQDGILKEISKGMKSAEEVNLILGKPFNFGSELKATLNEGQLNVVDMNKAINWINQNI